MVIRARLALSLLSGALGGAVACAASEPTAGPAPCAHAGIAEPAARATAVRELERTGHGALPCLLVALRDGNREVQVAALLAIERIEPAAAEVVPALTEIVRDGPSITSRSCAARLLEHQGAAAGAAVPALLAALRSGWTEVRAAAPSEYERLRDNIDLLANSGDALGAVGGEAADAVPLLIEILGGECPTCRVSAALALGAMGPAAREAVPALVAASRDPDASLRREAAAALGKVGPAAEAAVPALAAAQEDPDALVRMAAAGSLGGLAGSADALPVLLERWKRVLPLPADATEEAANERLITAEALWRMGRDGSRAVLAAAVDPDPIVRAHAVATLGQLVEGWNRQATESWRDSSGEPPFEWAAPVSARQKAVQRPGASSFVYKRFKPAFVAYLRELPWKRSGAGEAVARVLLRALSDREGAVRLAAAHALERLGAEGAIARPALHRAAADPANHPDKLPGLDGDIRQYARVALRAIQEELVAQDPEAAETDDADDVAGTDAARPRR